MFMKIHTLGAELGRSAMHAAAWSRTYTPSAREFRMAARMLLVAGLLFAWGLASAQGLVQMFNNASVVVRAIIGFISLAGVLVGLGFVFNALVKMWKKHNDDRNDISWGSIVGQAAAGSGCMALTWLAVQFVLTLGGSQSDIGRTLGG